MVGGAWLSSSCLSRGDGLSSSCPHPSFVLLWQQDGGGGVEIVKYITKWMNSKGY